MNDEQETKLAFARSRSNAGLGGDFWRCIECYPKICSCSEYKPGDLPPKGYLEWHEWADVQRKAGIKQKPCKRCGKWLTPQEVDSHMAQHFTDGIAIDALLTPNEKVNRQAAPQNRKGVTKMEQPQNMKAPACGLSELNAGLGLLPARVVAMCKARGWSMHWTHRGAYLHLESSELIEAIRGKHGDPADEAGDVLLVLMSITEHAGIPFAEVVARATAKLSKLETAPHYHGEEWSTPNMELSGREGKL